MKIMKWNSEIIMKWILIIWIVMCNVKRNIMYVYNNSSM